MRINNNLMAMNTHRQLGSANARGANSMEKLSSGFRINRAGDDAAGLSISEKMRAQIRGLNQASRNAQDGISLIQTAEGALSETHSILQRMRELAVQAANDTNVGIDREEIQKEINQLSSEINRIGNTTEFNTQKLLNGGAEAVGAVSVTSTTPSAPGAATGAVSTVTPTTTYAAATPVAASLTLDGALTVTATASGVGGNSLSVVVIQGANGTATSANATSGVLTITLGATGGGTALTPDAATIGALVIGGADAGNFSLSVVDGQGATQINVAGSANLAGGDPGTATSAVFSFDVTSAFATGDTVTIGGTGGFTHTFAASATVTGAATAIRAAITAGSGFTAGGAGATITLTQVTASSDPAPAVAVTGPGGTPGSTTFSITAALVEGETITAGGVTFEAAASATAAIGTGNIRIDLSSADTAIAQAGVVRGHLDGLADFNATGTSAQIILTQAVAGTGDVSAPVVTAAGGSGYTADLQIGANTAQSFRIDIDDMRALALGVTGATSGTSAGTFQGVEAFYVTATTGNVTDGTTSVGAEFALDVSTHEKATAAVSVINNAIETVSAERSKLGAFQNRLEHTISNLGTSSENMQAAESRIRDVDMAQEMMEFTKNNILQQAATAMLAQANQAPQAVLQLLR